MVYKTSEVGIETKQKRGGGGVKLICHLKLPSRSGFSSDKLFYDVSADPPMDNNLRTSSSLAIVKYPLIHSFIQS